jgi:L-lactate dehydrogenase complex protein LldG
VNAREEILARLTRALADNPAPAPTPRAYAVSRPTGDLTALLSDRLQDYHAQVHVTLPEALAGVSRLLVPADVPREWLDGFAGEVVVDQDAGNALPVADLDRVDAVLTGCTLAIAETGTIVLDGGPAQGRRALTLVPDRHVVVVGANQIVGGVPEAIRRLAAVASRPQTWISGPSATSDIELNRIEGVHGPRRLDVVIAQGARP